MSHYVLDGTLVFQPGKIRLNLYLLHWEHIVLLTTGSPGKFLLLFFNFWDFFALLCWFSTSSLIKLWPYVSNQFLDQTSTLYECFINKLQQGERDLYIQHTTLLPPNYEYPQHKTRLFLQSRWNVEGGKQREDWELDHHDASVPPQVLLSSSLGLCSPICSSQVHLHHSSPVRSISLPEDKGNPAFTPAQWLSTRNWFPGGYLANNVWAHFWLSQLRDRWLLHPVDRGRRCCDTPCNVQVPSPTKTCLVQMSTLLRLRKPAAVPCKTWNA